MAMVPAQTLPKHRQLYYNCSGYGGRRNKEEEEEEEEYNNYETPAEAGSLLGGGSDHIVVVEANYNPMAEDESTTTTTNYTTSAASLNNNNNEAGASSSKDVQATEEDDPSWLQLGIGSAKTNTQTDETRGGGRGGDGLVELDLLPARSTEGERVISQQDTRRVRPVATQIFHLPPRQPQVPSFLFSVPGAGSSSSTVLPPPPPPSHHQHQEINWTFRPTAPTSSNNPSSSSFVQLGSYFARTPFQSHSVGGDVNVGGSSLDFRVIDPPRRPHSGIWFSLQASQNQ